MCIAIKLSVMRKYRKYRVLAPAASFGFFCLSRIFFTCLGDYIHSQYDSMSLAVE